MQIISFSFLRILVIFIQGIAFLPSAFASDSDYSLSLSSVNDAYVVRFYTCAATNQLLGVLTSSAMFSSVKTERYGDCLVSSLDLSTLTGDEFAVLRVGDKKILSHVNGSKSEDEGFLSEYKYVIIFLGGLLT